MTDERRTLVIASHWDVREAKQEDRLVRLEPFAEELRELLLDPVRGACVPASGDGLLLNPASVAEVSEAVEEAFEGAQAVGASLLLGFLGHGYQDPGSGGFLFPLRSTPAVPGPETAFDLAGEVGRLAGRYGGVRELTVVVDGCFSGHALLGAARGWFSSAMLAGRRIELLSSSDDRVSYDLQFSRVLTGLIRRGDVRLDVFLGTGAVRGAVERQLRRQVPQAASYDGGAGGPEAGEDPWIAQNVAYDPQLSVLAWGPNHDVLLKPLHDFQPPAELAAIARLVGRHRLVAVVGGMGTGKTTLATALCRAELLPQDEADAAPAVCAVVRLDERWTSGNPVRDMAEQLGIHLPGFEDARNTYRTRVPAAERALLPSTVAEVGGPLGLMEARGPVRVVLDGIDQVTDPASRARMIAELTALRDAAPDWFGLVATVREGVRLPEDWHRVAIAAPDRDQLGAYLRSQRVPAAAREAILTKTEGNWQLTRVLALYRGTAARMIGTGFAVVYRAVLDPLRDKAPGGNGAWLDAVLVVVAASGVNVALPRPLLDRAAGELGGPGGGEAVGRVLDLLAGLVVRSPGADGPSGTDGTDGTDGTHDTGGADGTDATDGTPGPHATELIGVHHPSLIEHVANERDVVEGHRALYRALEIMAPMEQHTPDEPLHRYAEQSEPEHLWQAALGAPDESSAEALHDRLLRSLELRAAPEATVNRARWETWAERLAGRLGPESRVTLHARARTAYWTGKAGAYRRSRELYRELLPDQRRVLAADDPEPLETRARIAYATGEVGDFAEALELHREVLADQVRVLGPDDPRTLETRHHIAYWTGRGGDRAEALRLHEELLPDLERVLGPTDRAVLEERHYIAYWQGMLGRYDRALELHAVLLRDRIAVYGEEHEQIYFSRMNICKFLGESGRLREALDGFRELLPLATRVRGAYHPNTFLVRLNIARFTWESGDAVGSLALHEALLRDQRETLGDTHPAVMITRYNIIMLEAELGAAGASLAKIDTLLEERLERYRNPLHPEVITTRFGRARILAQLGDTAAAVAQVREVRDDRARVLGADHPDTLTAQSELDRLLDGGPLQGF
ncbi:tetratricopeptide repeat protein [Streptomyces sp. NPDC012888]|uniref:tetratricopeptide repeat protein n=1 Tax=Streptomyces sp. NPDC012888 TaxID=3364855 RepID=UPI0036B3F3E0